MPVSASFASAGSGREERREKRERECERATDGASGSWKVGERSSDDMAAR